MASIWLSDPDCPVCGNPTIRQYTLTTIGGVLLHCQRCQARVPLVSVLKFKKEGDRNG